MGQEHLYSVGDVSALCGLPIKTLHYYDQIGLLSPSLRNGNSGYRYYSDKQIYQLFKIKKLKLLGFSLKDIKELVQSDDTKKLVASVGMRLEAINQEILTLQGKYLEGVSFMNRLDEGYHLFCSMDANLNDLFWKETVEKVQIAKIPEANIIFIRDALTNYQNENVNIVQWAEVLKLADQFNVIPVSSLRVTYHHSALSQFFLKSCDYEIHVEVDRVCDSPEFKKFGGFRAAITYHVGSYATIINAHLRALRWIYENQYKVCGSITEEFLISPLDVMEEEKYLTKIIIPIEMDGTA